MSIDDREALTALLPAAAPEPVLPHADIRRAALLRELSTDPRPARRRTVRRWTPALAAGALAVTVAIAGTIGLDLHRERPVTPAGPVTSLADLLARVDAVTADAPAVNAKNSQFVYVRTLLQGGSFKTPTVKEFWYSVDGSRSDADREAGAALADNYGTHPIPGNLSVLDAALEYPTFRHLQRLAQSGVKPAGIYAEAYRLLPAGYHGRDEGVFATIENLLRADAGMSPRLCALLYHAAALIPGVTFVPDATDLAGRHGAGIAYNRGAEPNLILVDPATGALLGQWQADGGPQQTYLATGIVDQAGQQPGTRPVEPTPGASASWTVDWGNAPLTLPVRLLSYSRVVTTTGAGLTLSFVDGQAKVTTPDPLTFTIDQRAFPLLRLDLPGYGPTAVMTVQATPTVASPPAGEPPLMTWIVVAFPGQAAQGVPVTEFNDTADNPPLIKVENNVVVISQFAQDQQRFRWNGKAFVLSK